MPAPPNGQRVMTLNEITRRAIVDMADGYCQTCGRPAVLLFVRYVRDRFRRLVHTDNGVAVCALCRTSSRGLTIKQWVDCGKAPVMARLFIEDRIARRLPI